MQNVEKTIISQYANSPTICALIERMNEWIDPRADIEQFYNMVFNVATAQGYGLDVWGRIVGIGRHFDIHSSQKNFGYDTGLSDFAPFEQGVFASLESTTTVYELEDEAYRNIIMLKAMSNILYATAKNINQLLMNLFSNRGRAYYLTLGQMRARYVFEFELTEFEKTLVFKSNLLPRPSGVFLEFYQTDVSSTFGFAGSYLQPFEQGMLWQTQN